MSFIRNGRKVFIIDGNEVMAGGMTLYTIIKGDVYVLMLHTSKYIEDAGGKSDFDDETIYDTIAREMYEEFDKVISLKACKYLVAKSPPKYIERSSKYMICIHWCAYIKELDNHTFTEENAIQTTKWIKFNDLDRSKLNPRLQKLWLKLMIELQKKMQ